MNAKEETSYTTPTVKALRIARLATGLTQLDMAIKLGVTAVTVGKFERGKTTPNGEERSRLTDTLAGYGHFENEAIWLRYDLNAFYISRPGERENKALLCVLDDESDINDRLRKLGINPEDDTAFQKWAENRNWDPEFRVKPGWIQLEQYDDLCSSIHVETQHLDYGDFLRILEHNGIPYSDLDICGYYSSDPQGIYPTVLVEKKSKARVAKLLKDCQAQRAYQKKVATRLRDEDWKQATGSDRKPPSRKRPKWMDKYALSTEAWWREVEKHCPRPAGEELFCRNSTTGLLEPTGHLIAYGLHLRHEYYPETGRACAMDSIKEELRALEKHLARVPLSVPLTADVPALIAEITRKRSGPEGDGEIEILDLLHIFTEQICGKHASR
ncbi:helix-turn-helix transcriptional regulator [bacterium]|nr:helix-turn-helix transcriptional regulator [bacterium]